MIDTHAHLYAEEFDSDREEVLMNAIECGITKILLPNIDETTIERLHQLSNSSDVCVPMMGLHPCYVSSDYKTQLEIIKRQFEKHKYVAVGEIGIDLYWDKSTQDIQKLAFLEQCRWAREFGLPIAIHSRDSTSLIIDLLKSNELENVGGVFHCFGGTIEEAKEVVDMGFSLGIGGVLTFKNTTLREVLQHVSLDHIVIETDAPYLAPTPYRGKRNEPAYVIKVAEQLSYVYDLPLEHIIQRTTDNALTLFEL
ncbi:MAG: TatD family hydrolase [Bacteroidetes bacterium]|jgi:TatD DNase family protein|nr:TatD family hydrolase [Bacteroidota bacterium]